MDKNEIVEGLQKYKSFMKLHTHQPKNVYDEEGWIIQEKFDGVFIAVVRLPRKWLILSRNFKIINLPDFVADKILQNLFMPKAGYMYIGELCNPKVSLEVLSGMVNPNRVASLTEDQLEHMLVSKVFWHDRVNLHDLLSEGKDTMRYSERYHALCQEAQAVFCLSLKNADEVFDKIVEQGGEGIVYKRTNSQYLLGKRSQSQIKRVREHTQDLKCVGVVYGQGKRMGQIAALVMENEDGNFFNADLGRGWTDAKRKELTRLYECGETEHVLGIWEIKGLQASSTGKAIRLPKALARRYDKD